MVRRFAVLSLVVSGWACSSPLTPDGGADATPPDAATDAGVSPVAPAPPAVAAPPLLTPCTAGFREVTVGDDPAHCEPWPEAGRETCGEYEAHFPGTPGCTPIGAPCPAGDFADSLPTGPIVYVLAGATGGDGTESAPFGSIADGVRAAGSSATLALGKGTYDETVRLTPGVVIRGACASETRITNTTGSATVPTLSIAGASVQVRDLSIVDTTGPAVYVGPGASAQFDGVVISGAHGVGVAVFDAGSFTGRQLVVRGSRAPPGAPFGGRAFEISGGTLDLEFAVLDDNQDVCVFARAEAEVLLSRTVIAGTQPRADGSSGMGLHLRDGSQGLVRDTVISGNYRAAVAVSVAGTVLNLERVVLERSASDVASGLDGNAISVEDGATAALRQCLIRQNRGIALWAIEPGSDLTLEDTVIVNTAPRDPSLEGGLGIYAEAGAAVHLARVWITRSHEAGVAIDGPTTRLDGEDVTVVGTLSRESDGQFGRGMGASHEAEFVLQRVLLRGNQDCGLCFDRGANVQFDDLIVENTRERSADSTFGRGIGMSGGATGVFRRVAVRGNREIGVAILEAGTTARFEDLEVRETDSEDAFDEFGRGIAVEGGASGTVVRSLIELNRELGVMVLDPDSVLSMEDTAILHTLPQRCGETTCADRPFGHGAGAYVGGTLLLSRFVIRDAALCGVHLAGSGFATLTDGEVTGTTIGVCLQVPGYDVDRLTGSVHYSDNGVNLDTTSLPLPTPANGLE